MAGSITLKWGTIKGWEGISDDVIAVLQEWSDLGASMSAMQQRDTPEQKALICRAIDLVDEPIFNDWSGEEMTREEAKKYIMEYGN